MKSSGNPQIDWKCEKEGKCIISYHIDLNSTLLNVTITPGDYELLLIYFLKDNSEIDGAIGGPFLPYSLHITAAPLIE